MSGHRQLFGVIDDDEILHVTDTLSLRRDVPRLLDLEGRGYEAPQENDAVTRLHNDLVRSRELGALPKPTAYLRADLGIGGTFPLFASAEYHASRLGNGKTHAR